MIRVQPNGQGSSFNIGGRAALAVGIAVSFGTLAAEDKGWHTADQATRGHPTYNSYCAQCHGPDLNGAMGPPLRGDAFLNKWSNKPLIDLFNYSQSKMPPTNPGSVPEDKMWLITAYILQKNGFPAGSSPLNAQTANRPLVKSP
jgi:mono/diheme cytochrome c family protein